MRCTLPHLPHSPTRPTGSHAQHPNGEAGLVLLRGKAAATTGRWQQQCKCQPRRVQEGQLVQHADAAAAGSGEDGGGTDGSGGDESKLGKCLLGMVVNYGLPMIRKQENIK